MPETRMLGAVRSELSPWVTLVARTIERPGAQAQTYHSLAQADYVSVLALTADGRVPLVRQYRPAIERITLELPGGLLDTAETPAAVAARELEEEAGLRASAPPLLLGKLLPDTGRLENRFWGFFVRAAELPGWKAEANVERVLVSRAELRQAILDGSFDHALHIALVGLALVQGHFSWEGG
jgi:ADP-ribose pyrophosphatase